MLKQAGWRSCAISTACLGSATVLLQGMGSSSPSLGYSSTNGSAQTASPLEVPTLIPSLSLLTPALECPFPAYSLPFPDSVLVWWCQRMSPLLPVSRGARCQNEVGAHLCANLTLPRAIPLWHFYDPPRWHKGLARAQQMLRVALTISQKFIYYIYNM